MRKVHVSEFATFTTKLLPELQLTMDALLLLSVSTLYTALFPVRAVYYAGYGLCITEVVTSQ